jgi:hypothetical protein
MAMEGRKIFRSRPGIDYRLKNKEIFRSLASNTASTMVDFPACRGPKIRSALPLNSFSLFLAAISFLSSFWIVFQNYHNIIGFES